MLIALYLNPNSKTQTTRPSFLIVFLLQLTLDWFPQLLPCLSSCQLLMVLARYDKCWVNIALISWDVNYRPALSSHKSHDSVIWVMECHGDWARANTANYNSFTTHGLQSAMNWYFWYIFRQQQFISGSDALLGADDGNSNTKLRKANWYFGW